MRSNSVPSIDGLTLAGLFFLAVMLFNLLAEPATSLGAVEEPAVASATPIQPDWNAVAAPYEHYIVTQGLHGFSYGHAAIDLTAGEGAPILSPIYGQVVDFYIDQWGNPTLVIENERYRVTLLHGLYTVSIGEFVELGEPIGAESNQGNTVDFQGRSCAGRDCGYHTHINIFDKQRGENVNPLELFGK